MGKALQIRVSAVTWDEALLEKLWPRLSELAFSIPQRPVKKGVLEMTYALGDGLEFLSWSKERREILGEGIIKAVETARLLEDSIAAWDPRKANTLSDALEDILSTLEAKLRS